MPPDRDIAVVGMACRFPHARDLTGFWRVVRNGEVTFEDIGDTRWKHSSFHDPNDMRAVDKTYAGKGAFIDGIDEFAALHFGLAPRRVQVMDPQQRLLVETTRQALEDAGYDKRSFDRRNTGVFVGASVNEYKDLLIARVRAQMLADGSFGNVLTPGEAEAVRAASADVVPMRAFSIAGGLLNMIAATVSQTFDFAGPSFSLDTACSSALVAIHEAVLHLRTEQCNVALAGGVYLNLVPDNLIGFSRIGAISPSGVCRPFDARADGFVMGEGAGVVVLKRLQDARADNDRIYAIIRGTGTNNDGRGEGPMTPRLEGQIGAMERAHLEARIPVESIGFVEAHGTATTVGDAIEVGALRNFFNQRAGKTLCEPFCYLSSIKANIGHTMSAAGVAGFIKAVLVLHHRTIVPQPSCEEPNPRLELDRSPFRIARELLPWPAPDAHPRRAAVSSFGFGGSNAHLLLEEVPYVAPSTRAEAQLFLISAPNPALLSAHLLALADTIATQAPAPMDVAYTLSTRTAHQSRVAFVATTREDLIANLKVAAADPQKFAYAPAPLPEQRRRIAFLFPGQGAQRVGLLKDLVTRFPAMRMRLAALDRQARFLDTLYPEPPYDDADAQRRLTRTEVCQPAMAALGIALGEMLQSLGVHPSVVVGHSLGEFSAASVAGMLTGEQAVKLVAERGNLMNALDLRDAGAMIAVMAGPSAVAPLVGELAGLWLANINHPMQVVLSGLSDSVQRARDRLQAGGIKTVTLDVSHAFHSGLMKEVNAGMTRLLEPLALQAARIPVVSCITGMPYTTAEAAKEIWARHATAPVDFVSALKSAVAAGANLFIQVGAGNSLLSFARAAAPDATFLALAPAEKADAGAAFLDALGHLFAMGIDLDAALLFDASITTLVTLPPVPLETQRYWGIERPAFRRAPILPVTSVSNEKEAPMDKLVALFREQTALLQSQAEIMKTQALALAQLGVAVPSVNAQVLETSTFTRTSTSAALRPHDLPAEPAEDLRTKVQSGVIAAVSRISAFPLTALKLEQTLTGELGFDSLMLVELDSIIAKTWPRIGGLTRELFTAHTTIANVIDHLVHALETEAMPLRVAHESPDSPIARYAPLVIPMPLHTLRENVISFAAPVLITDDQTGIAQVLAATLAARGMAVEIGNATTPGNFAGVICFATGLAAPMHVLLGLAKRLGESAGCFVAITNLGGNFGFDGAALDKLEQVGVLGFTKALAQEWPECLVKAMDVDTGLGAATIAQQVSDELFSADRRVEVGFTMNGRVGVSLAPAAKIAGPSLSSASVVIVTGGTKGLGYSFAMEIARRYRCTVALASRRPTTEAEAAIINAGARSCSYHEMDTRDAASVRKAVNAVRMQHGRVDAVIHAAGVIADSRVATKDEASLDDVIHTKVSGALALLDATAGDAMTLFVLIGSWAGRFGNAGQTDYSAANEMMARIVATPRPGTRMVAIDFPPLEGSTMAARIPAFRKREMMASGVTFLTQEQGVQALLDEIEAGQGEIVLGRALPERMESYRATFPVSRLSHVYLNDHKMNGRHVLPLAAALDCLAAAAVDACPELHNAFTVSDFRLERPVLVPDTSWLATQVNFVVRNGHASSARAELMDGKSCAYHATVGSATQAPAAKPPAMTEGGVLPLSLREFYNGITFHGALLQGIDSIDAITDDGICGTVHGSTPLEWVKKPLRSAWAVDPLIVDSGFQLAAYWAWTKHRRTGFPVGFREFTQYRLFGNAPVKCTARFEEETGDRFIGNLVWQDAHGEVLARMTGAEAEFKKHDTLIAGSETATPDASTYDPAHFPEYQDLQKRIHMADAIGLRNPYFSIHEGICLDTTVVDGREMINFSSYSYVGNSGDPVVSAAAKDAIDQYGTSVSASRLVSGENPLTIGLEQGLARFFGTEACLVFVSGNATNVTVIGHMCGPDDLILHDAYAHDSVIQGARLSGGVRRPFPHNDWEALDRTLTVLRGHYRRVLICIEGAYSMDGDIPDLPRFIEIKKKHKAMLMVDEAHSAGVVGKTGRGVGEYWNVERRDVEMWMGTLSKSFASCGGYICGSKELVEYLKYTAPGFVYSVGISPPNAAAALAALEQIDKHPERVTKAQANARHFLALLRERGIDTGKSKDSALVPAILGNSILCLQLSARLRERNINVQPILYPAVEEHMARLRFFISSLHSDQQLVTTADILAEEYERLKPAVQTSAVA